MPPYPPVSHRSWDHTGLRVCMTITLVSPLHSSSNPYSLGTKNLFRQIYSSGSQTQHNAAYFLHLCSCLYNWWSKSLNPKNFPGLLAVVGRARDHHPTKDSLRQKKDSRHSLALWKQRQFRGKVFGYFLPWNVEPQGKPLKVDTQSQGPFLSEHR